MGRGQCQAGVVGGAAIHEHWRHFGPTPDVAIVHLTPSRTALNLKDRWASEPALPIPESPTCSKFASEKPKTQTSGIRSSGVSLTPIFGL